MAQLTGFQIEEYEALEHLVVKHQVNEEVLRLSAEREHNVLLGIPPSGCSGVMLARAPCSTDVRSELARRRSWYKVPSCRSNAPVDLPELAASA
jgi:hypothetical protein